MKHYKISEQDLLAILEYLSERPYKEVAGAIMALKNLPEVTDQ